MDEIRYKAPSDHFKKQFRKLLQMIEEPPDYRSVYSVGQKVMLKQYQYNTKYGKKEGGKVQAVITEAFWDYENGWKYHGEPIPYGPEKIYFGEWEIIP